MENGSQSTGFVMAFMGLGIFSGPAISSTLMENISTTAPFYFFLICAVAIFVSSIIIEYPPGSVPNQSAVENFFCMI